MAASDPKIACFWHAGRKPFSMAFSKMKENHSFTSGFVNVSVFGSFSRGEQDEYSDFDVLAIVKDGAGKQSERLIYDWASRNNMPIPSISWYGENKIRNFFSSGDLFSWHLYLESKPVANFPSIDTAFGMPAKYTYAFDSICELSEILDEVPAKLNEFPRSRKFEMGVVYVCLRNIAMAASWHLCEKPNFGRYSPYSIECPRFPIGRHTYDFLALCRMAGQRGWPIKTDRKIDLDEVVDQVQPWVEEIKKATS